MTLGHEYAAAARLGYGVSTDIISRLEGVRDSGAGQYMAKCPAHDDRTPSLSVKVLNDRTLVHCFSGCSVEAILDALGLTFVDLFPESARKSSTKPRRPARRLLQELDREALVVAIVAADMLAEKTITEPVFERLATAVSRISKARDEVAPARHRP